MDEADAGRGLRACRRAGQAWNTRVTELTAGTLEGGALPAEADVIGAVRDSAADSPGGDIVVCAAGTLPAELHKLWRTSARRMPHG